MHKIRNLCLLITMLCVTTGALADWGNRNNGSNNGPVNGPNNGSNCPDQAIQQMNYEFGYGTSERTDCIENRNNIKSVIAWNLASVNNTSGQSQQAKVTSSVIDNWENMYGMVINQNFEVVVIAYSGGARWALTDAAYNRTYNVSTGNPTGSLTASLIARGATVYMCQNAMRGNSWVTSDLLPGVQMVPAGAVSVIDHTHSGYEYLNP